MLRKTELERLNRWKTTFANGKLPEVAPILAEYGYDDAKMTEGETLLNGLIAVYDRNQVETAESREANKIFSQAYNSAMKQYRLHRRAAKSVLLDDTAVWDRYGLVGEFPDAFLPRLREARKLYQSILADEERQPVFAAVKLTTEEAQRMLSVLDDVDAKEKAYAKEEGESQDATKQKDEGFARAALWMRRFYGIARVAFADRPQLLETLGVKVKS